MAAQRNPEAVARALRSAERIALIAHVSPDGDAIGSTLALAHGLAQLGKEAVAFCQDKVPDNLRFLPGAEAVRLPEAAEGDFDLAVAVDVADEGRMGRCQEIFHHAAATAQVDHHGTNPGYAAANDIDPAASATALLVKELLSCLGVTMTREIGLCIYTGVSTDTGNFAFSNTTPEAFYAVGDILEGGELPLSQVNRVLFRQRSRAQTLLIGRALGNLQFFARGRIAAMRVTRQDFADCGALPEHTDTIVNFGIDVEGVKMALLAREAEDGLVKMSLRALAPCAVDGVAKRFGGGGHALAAGCTLPGPIDQAMAQVVSAMEEALIGADA